MVYLLKMVIFHGYVNKPDGKSSFNHLPLAIKEACRFGALWVQFSLFLSAYPTLGISQETIKDLEDLENRKV
jgi:hypothetical protein